MLTLLLSGGASALEFDTGNPDLSIRWDNTVRAQLGVRVENRDTRSATRRSPTKAPTASTRATRSPSASTWLSELDVVYKKRYGAARQRAPAWYDAAYGGTSQPQSERAAGQHPELHRQQVQRARPSASTAAAPASSWTPSSSARVDLGDVPVQAKLGRHTVYWGESLFLGGNLHGIAYAQNPLDLQKGFATPGTEAKELFRPLNQLSLQAQVTDTLSVAGAGMLEWEAARYPEGGTYLGPVDFVFNGPDRQFLSPGPRLRHARRRGPSRSSTGELGLSARWSPEWLDGTARLLLPQLRRQAAADAVMTAGRRRASASYNLVYADNIQLFGVSLAKNIGGVSIGAEFSYRHNTPLNAPGARRRPGLPRAGRHQGPARRHRARRWSTSWARSPKTPVFDAATWAAELTWSHWTKVTQRREPVQRRRLRALRNGTPTDSTSGTAARPRTTSASALAFTPTWFQVLPGVDLSAPVTLRGRPVAATRRRSSAATRAWATTRVGVGADVLPEVPLRPEVHRLLRPLQATTAPPSPRTNGFTTFLRDRGFVSLTFKTTF